MSAVLHKLDGEPILVVTYEGHITLADVEATNAQIAQALSEAATPYYGIIDVRNTIVDFPELLRILWHQSQDAAGTIAAERQRVVLVGVHPLVRLFRNLLAREQFGGFIVPIFPTLETALDAVRARIRADAQG